MFIQDPEMLQDFSSDKRLWQGIPTVECTPGGRIFVTFYSGKRTEELGNYCVLLMSEDGGETFSEPIAAAYDGEDHRCYDPCLWLDPTGCLWFTWAVLPDHGVWAVRTKNPDAQTLQWDAPRRIGGDVMMNKPVALSDGRYLFPIAVWRKELVPQGWGISEETERKSFVYESLDGGETIKRLGGAEVADRWFDEHAVVERADGSLMMYVRTKYGIGQSFSFDGGRTWTEGGDTGLGGPNSRFCLQRTPTGRLLLVNHWKFTGRSHLTAFLSEDDGVTWKGGLLLDERSDISYPSAAWDAGKIRIVYDRERGAAYNGKVPTGTAAAREILMATVTEEDILAGKPVTETCRLKQIVNKLLH